MNDVRRAVFLDRDGTLNVDFGYVHRSEDWQWLPHVVEGLARLKAAGFALVVTSNQSGIARGMFDAATVDSLHQWVNSRLAPHKASIDSFCYCPHLPTITGNCDCRKPAPVLLLRAARELDIDLAASWSVGDRLRDAQAGLAAGCRAILVNATAPADIPAAVTHCTDFAQACDIILNDGASQDETRTRCA